MSSSFTTFRFRRFIVPFAAALLALAPFHFCPAQTATKPPPAPIPHVSVAFSIFSLDNDISGLKYDANGRANTIFIPSSYKPMPIQYNGVATLTLYRSATGEDGKATKTPAMEINFPRTSGAFLVLAKEIGGGRFATMVINDDPTPHSLNSWRFINLSNTQIGFVLVDFKKFVSIPPGGTQELRLGDLKELGSPDGYSDGVAYLPDPKSRTGWSSKMAHSTRYLYIPGRPRTAFLLLDPKDPNRVIVKIIDNSVRGKGSSASATPARNSNNNAPQKNNSGTSKSTPKRTR
jgi:hypothetical protein